MNESQDLTLMQFLATPEGMRATAQLIEIYMTLLRKYPIATAFLSGVAVTLLITNREKIQPALAIAA